MIRRALLKAVAIPGYQVPFGSREMPLAYGWGTGGIQVTAAVHRPATTCSRSSTRARTTPPTPSTSAASSRAPPACATTERTREATHHPDAPPHPRAAAAPRARSSSTRCRSPSRCYKLEPRRRETLKLHAFAEYGLMHVKLYEDIAQLGPHRHQLRLPGAGERPLRDVALADPEVRQPEDAPHAGAAALRRRPREAHLRDPALHRREEPGLRRPPVPHRAAGPRLRAVRLHDELPRRGDDRRRARRCGPAPTPITAANSRRAAHDHHRAAAARAAAQPPVSPAPRDGALGGAARPRSNSARARCWPSSANRARARSRC